MIALFDSHDALVDYTFTTPDGAFALQAPESAGTYRLEASHGADSVRPHSLKYDPGKPSASVLLTTESPSWWTRTGRLVENKLETLLGTLAGTISGLLLGYSFSRMTKKRQDRELFDQEVAALRHEREDVIRTWAEIKNVVAEEKGLGFDDNYKKPGLIGRFQASLADLRSELERVNPSKLDTSVIWAAKGKDGLKQRHALESSLEKLTQFSAAAATLPPADWTAADAAFTSFKTNPLLSDKA